MIGRRASGRKKPYIPLIMQRERERESARYAAESKGEREREGREKRMRGKRGDDEVDSER